MAVATGTLGRRRNREAADAAARQRRSRMLLIGLSVLLAIVAVIEVPATLSKLNKKSVASGAASTTATDTAVATGGVTAATIKAARAKLALIDRRFPVKDPFEAQLGDSAATVSVNQPFATAPAVRSSHFVAKDPFKAQLGVDAGQAVTAVPIATGPAVSAPASGLTSEGVPAGGATAAAPTSGYIVVLRSLDSKAAGLEELKLAHIHGFPSAQLLFSSKYSTLRHGYWVVYSRYPSASGANAGVARARAHGYLTAYRRVAKP